MKTQTEYVINKKGTKIDYKLAVELMDSELVESLLNDWYDSNDKQIFFHLMKICTLKNTEMNGICQKKTPVIKQGYFING